MGLFAIVYYALVIFQLLILARVLMSWIPSLQTSMNPTTQQIVRLIYQATEPVLKPVRDLLPRTMMVDLSPMIVLLLLSLITRLIR